MVNTGEQFPSDPKVLCCINTDILALTFYLILCYLDADYLLRLLEFHFYRRKYHHFFNRTYPLIVVFQFFYSHVSNKANFRLLTRINRHALSVVFVYMNAH